MKKTMSLTWLRIERMSDLTMDLLCPALLIVGGLAVMAVGTIR